LVIAAAYGPKLLPLGAALSQLEIGPCRSHWLWVKGKPLRIVNLRDSTFFFSGNVSSMRNASKK
jgi:hypothetical protein